MWSETSDEISLLSLPNELLLMVANELTETCCINALVQVNRRFYQLLNLELYRHDARNRDTALHWAIRNGSRRTADVAIRAGCDIERFLNNTTPLMAAAKAKTQAKKKKKINFLKMLLEKGANPNTQDSRGRTALNFAVQNNNNDRILVLLGKGANPNTQDVQGSSPLHTPHLLPKVVETLLTYGANPSIQNHRLGSPLHVAATQLNLSVVRSLLKAGADPSALDYDGKSPLFNAMLHQDKGLEIARVLLENGANVRRSEEAVPGPQPIHCAVQTGHIAGIQLLLEFNADVNAPSHTGESVLNMAALTGRTLLARYLVAAGAEVGVDSDGRNPLHLALDHEDGVLCQLILENDPDPDIRELFSSLSIEDYDCPQAVEVLSRKGLSAHRMKKILMQPPKPQETTMTSIPIPSS
ncbi:ankyrin repeats (3 copies) domain-containing protein [Penicillium malachiteum]|uniref:ankyrin repeats (3 copies) domain-containing protein n=1 Tax=Penicillium malachiteum TaxID=1324776 RepID=UPI002548BA6A|nr:ankyrin repeats (3 copies) domain-containing protein [Penicillium malachiteum]KAJ5736256.1 ankyrin repeats (3 copies) domain-containing protein [Penicillium malachiteum]